MTKNNALLLVSLFLVFINGCAALQPGYETPVVTISSFEAIPAQGMVPQFQIGLHIVNPNRSALNLKGVSYTISLEGHQLMTGVSNQLPKIEPYGEGDVVLNATVSLFNGILFLKDLVGNQQRKEIAYTLKAKLDAGNLHPLIRVTQKGSLSFKQPI
ncbi:hypothetical protein HRM2_12510 [Desulforapulum autotrophicum HRM2]|uniref:Water stress and hypersensitive response domain-containing protein n=1 Tax=Desulforapulum autotrophicum (strain ATCC 43914 / DSM 3382 / VKM B-1955 / HRM2) TaxID=177437 RepID=C0QM57_DESAH|nr:LEA type 2 family protein [Desulforapulum autotrophicum]ACN14363.1 hypothetical protein HRM2_12510 [Desulforapulum autotrophicum HRM2]